MSKFSIVNIDEIEQERGIWEGFKWIVVEPEEERMQLKFSFMYDENGMSIGN